MTDTLTPDPPGRPVRSRSIIVKVLIIFGLILGLLIPLMMIGGVIQERQSNRNAVQSEISRTWASEQTLLGPVLVIPYAMPVETVTETGKKQTQMVQELAYLLPQHYRTDSRIQPEARYRGIYQCIVYLTQVTAEGAFNLKPLEELGIPPKNIMWKNAFLALGIPSMKGIDRKPAFDVSGKPKELLPGVNGATLISGGLYTPFSLNGTEKQIPFKLSLSLKGSRSFSIVPIGKQNTMTMTSAWPSPSFVGGTLPSDRKVSGKGFAATWEIPYFARSFGQTFTNADKSMLAKFPESAVGVELLTPVDSYRQSERAVKYGMLFLVLTFSTYFLFEIISHYRLHPFQYLLVGCALSLFYLLLIALSEIMAFELAYSIASLATIAVIALYSGTILGKIRRSAAWIIGGLLSLLYIYLYILLQLEDLSLLFGAIGLFIVLAAIMYITRNIDWYNESVSV